MPIDIFLINYSFNFQFLIMNITKERKSFQKILLRISDHKLQGLNILPGREEINLKKYPAVM